MQTDSVGPPPARGAAARPSAPPDRTPGEDVIEELLADDDWWLQPMLAGRPVRVRRSAVAVVAVDRDGRLFQPPANVADAVRAAASDACVFDGELVDHAAGGGGHGEAGIYHVFDLLERDGHDLRDLPYALRYDAAVDLVDAVPDDALRFTATAVTQPAKRALLARLRAAGLPGVVFRHRLGRRTGEDAAHRPVALTFTPRVVPPP